MQCAALPPKILQSVDRISRDFLWGTSNCKRKLHLVGWKKIPKPKKEGGGGVGVTISQGEEYSFVRKAKLEIMLSFRKC